MPKRRINVRKHDRVLKSGKVTSVNRHNRNIDDISKDIDRLIKRYPRLKPVSKVGLKTDSWHPDPDIYKALTNKEKIGALSEAEAENLERIREHRLGEMFNEYEEKRVEHIKKMIKENPQVFTQTQQEKLLSDQLLNDYIRIRPKDEALRKVVEDGRLKIIVMDRDRFDKFAGNRKEVNWLGGGIAGLFDKNQKIKYMGAMTDFGHYNLGIRAKDLKYTIYIKGHDISDKYDLTRYEYDRMLQILAHEIAHYKQALDGKREFDQVLKSDVAFAKEGWRHVGQYLGVVKKDFIKRLKKDEKSLKEFEKSRDEYLKWSEDYDKRYNKTAYSVRGDPRNHETRAYAYGERFAKLKLQYLKPKLDELENSNDFTSYT